MPLAVRVVSEKDYAAWLDMAKKKFANDERTRTTAVAAAEVVEGQ